MRRESLLAAAAVAGLATLASGAIFNEVEPNDSKAAANAVNLVGPGDTIVGNSTASTTTGLDYFLVTTPSQPAGIYRNRLVVTSDIVGHTATIRSLSQTAAPPDTQPGIPWDGVIGTFGTTEGAAQTSSTATTPLRFNQWYTFGTSASMYYRVTGTASTTANYTATYEQEPVTATDIGTYAPGQISISTFSQGHTTDTDLWVYDGNFNPITGYGNDDEGPLGGSPGTGASLQSFLSRDYAPGTYYLALSNFALTLNQPSPSDDDFRTGALLDLPGVLVNSSTTLNLNLAFTITDSLGTTLQVANTKTGAYDVNFFRFTVVPEPASLGLLALAAPALLRRRRA